MKAKGRQYGVTLVEMTVVVAIVALLVSLGLPAIRTLFNSFESQQGAHTLISSSLASARALAAKEQRYAGIRFQHRDDPNGRGAQYMIFIVYDANLPHYHPSLWFQAQGNLGCCAAVGSEPIKLPDSVGVMEVVKSDSEVDGLNELTDKTTFSILFSPSGKLVIHNLWVVNRDGETTNNSSRDDIFNVKANVEAGIAMFFQDVEVDGLRKELSRNSFIVYDRNLFDKVDVTKRYSDCLSKSETVYINPYTGTMIKR
jgi:prepilin-type N-terminal cleavage/methylation domain-containing protein